MAMASINRMIKRRCFGTLYAKQDDGSEAIINTFIFEDKATIEIETPYGDLVEVGLSNNILVSLRNQLNSLMVILEAE